MMLNNKVLKYIEKKLKQGKRIELEYNHQTNEVKILEHKITRVRVDE